MIAWPAVRAGAGAALHTRREVQPRCGLAATTFTSALCPVKALDAWRRQWLARAACRRLYTRRALLGWHERTVELRIMRARLYGAARLLMHGCLLRCFSAWNTHSRVRAASGLLAPGLSGVAQPVLVASWRHLSGATLALGVHVCMFRAWVLWR